MNLFDRFRICIPSRTSMLYSSVTTCSQCLLQAHLRPPMRTRSEYATGSKEQRPSVARIRYRRYYRPSRFSLRRSMCYRTAYSKEITFARLGLGTDRRAGAVFTQLTLVTSAVNANCCALLERTMDITARLLQAKGIRALPGNPNSKW